MSLDIRWYSDRNIFDKRIVRLLSDLGLDLVIDVGANRGQFGSTLYEHGFGGTLVSFEPIPAAYGILEEVAARSGQDWRVAPRLALTSAEGTAYLTLAQNSASSSLLEFSEQMGTVVPVAKAVDRLSVATARLDEVLDTLGLKHRRFALKIDTQGSEMAVLEGSTGVEAQIGLIMLEASIAQLYVGQPSYHEIDQYLRQKGWSLRDIEPGYRNPRTLHLCEFDAVYVR
ncbi:MAG: FkbM family methyltransferase [Hyphomicrobiaceae bacterium]